MSNTDLEMFMEKLRRLVYKNCYTTSVGNNPFIKARKPEIQLLYQELSYLIGFCFKDRTIDEDQPHEIEDVANWKKSLIEAANKAEDTIDMFVSSAIINHDFKYNIFNPEDNIPLYVDTLLGYHDQYQKVYQQEKSPVVKRNLIDCSLKDLKDVIYNLKSIRQEIMSYKKDNSGNLFQNLAKQDTMKTKFEATGTTNTRMKSQHEELIVGFDEDALSIIDRLTGYRKKLDIISIVGMGGLGKTTLATKIFNDSLVEYHFDMRGWVTVSQVYSTQDVLLQLLVSIGKSVDEGTGEAKLDERLQLLVSIGKSVDHEATSEAKLCEMLYQSLKGRKYLIVIDDVWTCKAWDDVALCFPDDNTGSRVLVTTRLTEVALHASQGAFTHNLKHLNKDQSWELLCKKTFRGYECPESLIETGKLIAKKCGGLPLALVVIAGLLEKGEKRKDLWENIAKSVGSYIINDPNGYLDTLALSYDHLPSHLKKCFLYVGGFPENYEVQVRRLIKLWMAEGFIKESGQRSLEEEGEDHLMDLIDRNLLIVVDKSSNGGIKSCRLHGLLREICLKKASEEIFFKKMSIDNNPFFGFTSSMVKQRRLFTDSEVLYSIHSHDAATCIRSVLCFSYRQQPEYTTTSWVSSFLLLRVLDLLNISLGDFRNIRILVHLRYLAVWSDSHDFLILKAGLWSLQTLIIKGEAQSFLYLPENTVNLRHLRCHEINLPIDFSVSTMFNLQTMSRIRLDHRTQFLLECFPDIKKLGCFVSPTSSNRGLLTFAMLTHLEALNIDKYGGSLALTKPIKFPETLRKLTLKRLYLPCNFMSTIQQLPKLEVLKLLESSFSGHLWKTGDEQFHQLKFLKIEKLNIRDWEASSINFPRLRKLVVRSCEDLKEIPLRLGNIYTLEHIEIDYSNSRVLESVNRIQEAQREMGNYDINVSFIRISK